MIIDVFLKPSNTVFDRSTRKLVTSNVVHCAEVSCRFTENCSLHKKNACIMVTNHIACPYGEVCILKGYFKHDPKYPLWISEMKSLYGDYIEEKVKTSCNDIYALAINPEALYNVNDHVFVVMKYSIEKQLSAINKINLFMRTEEDNISKSNLSLYKDIFPKSIFTPQVLGVFMTDYYIRVRAYITPESIKSHFLEIFEKDLVNEAYKNISIL